MAVGCKHYQNKIVCIVQLSLTYYSVEETDDG